MPAAFRLLEDGILNCSIAPPQLFPRQGGSTVLSNDVPPNDSNQLRQGPLEHLKYAPAQGRRRQLHCLVRQELPPEGSGIRGDGSPANY
jgi:hypothetical protein